MVHGLEIINAINALEDPDKYMLQTSGIVNVHPGRPAKEEDRKVREDGDDTDQPKTDR